MDREISSMRGKIAMALLCAGTSFLSSPVFAQAEATPVEVAEAGSGEIVVTAQRRAELSQNVPISITALSAGQLERANVQTLTDISKLTPALRFDYVGPNVQATIRGVGTSIATSGGLGNVGIYVDGFYVPNPLGSDFQLLNVAGVQVLKGPQGTLFGRNTTAGAIIVSTRKPSSDASVKAEVAYSSFNTQRFQGYATVGLSEALAIDVEGQYRKSDGYVRNIFTGNDKERRSKDWTIRTGALLTLSDDISFLARYSHNDDDDTSANVGNPFVLNGIPLSTALQPAVIAMVGTPLVTTRPSESSNERPVGFHGKADVFQLTGTFDFDAATLTSYTQYRVESSVYNADLDATSSPVFYLRVRNREKTISQELLLSSKPGSPLQWTAGMFYFNYVDGYPAVAGSTFGSPIGVFTNSSSRSESIAAFGDFTYQVSDKLFLTAGARFSHDTVTDAYFSVPAAAGVLSRVNVPSIKSDRVTPRVVVRYKPDESSSVYASATLGYKPGLLNVGGQSLAPIAPEKITAFEVGYKFASPAFSADLASYYYKYKDLQVVSLRGTSSIVSNAAASRIWGMEAEFRYSPIARLDLNFAAAYTDAKYTSFESSPFYDLTTPFLYDVTTRPGGASGRRMLRAPKFTGTAGLRYSMDLFGGNLVTSGTFYYTSGFAFDSSGQFYQKAYETLGLRAEWTDPSDHYTLAVFGDNVTDSRYRTQVLPGNFGIGNFWSAPATVGVSARVKY